MPALRELPEGTFGKEYTKFLDKNVSNIMHVYYILFWQVTKNNLQFFARSRNRDCVAWELRWGLGHQGNVLSNGPIPQLTKILISTSLEKIPS